MGKSRLTLGLLLPLGLLLIASVRNAAGAPPAPEPQETLTEKAGNALEAGLGWLAKDQRPDGSWTADVGYKHSLKYIVTVHNKPHVGVTALAGMTLLNADRGKEPGAHQKQVAAAVKFVLSCQGPDGLFTKHGTRMYSHAFATRFLAEYCSVTKHEAVRLHLQRAVTFTCRCQAASGGWGYSPFTREVDLSVTACQFMALQAARYGGAKVPRQTLERALDYVLNSANTTLADGGSFQYEHRDTHARRSRTSFALTAAGLAVLGNAGLNSDAEITAYLKRRNMTRFLGAQPPPRTKQIIRYLKDNYLITPRRHYRWYFGNLFAVQALRDTSEWYWEEYFSRVRSDLLSDQNKDGSWPVVESMIGLAYSTASACLILQAHCLPAAPLTKAKPAEGGK